MSSSPKGDIWMPRPGQMQRMYEHGQGPFPAFFSPLVLSLITLVKMTNIKLICENDLHRNRYILSVTFLLQYNASCRPCVEYVCPMW